MSLVVSKSSRESIVLTVFDLVNHLNRSAETIAAQGGLTVKQWLVLLQVAGDPNFPRGPGRAADRGVLASQIADARGVSRANVSPSVTALLGRGLILQEEDPRDRRCKRLVPTPEGLAVLARLEPLRRRANAGLFAGFENGELETLGRLARRLLKRLTRRDEAALPGRDG